MKIGLLELGRRMARLCVVLLLIPSGMFTLALFLATGRPLPREFIPVDQLSFGMRRTVGLSDAGPKDGFEGLSPDGRCVFTSHLTDDPHYRIYSAFDSVTMEMLGSYRHYLYGVSSSRLSRDKQQLASFNQGRLQLQNLGSGKEEIIEIDQPRKMPANYTWKSDFLVFVSGNSQLLLYSPACATLYDPIDHRTLAEFEQKGRGDLEGCFLDNQNRSKALVYNSEPAQYEVWDIASRRRDFIFDKSELEKRGLKEFPPYGFVCVMGAGVLVTPHPDAKLLLVRSVTDGRPLQTCSIPIKDAELLRLSPNGHNETCKYTLRNPLVRLAEGWQGGLKAKLQEMFPDSERLVLLDLQTGIMCRDLMGGFQSTFTDDSTRLISYTLEGRYAYDVPPRWQSFTPWAWAALAAWLSLIVLWWKLRKRQLGLAAIG